MPASQGQVGEQSFADGTSPLTGYRQGRRGDTIISQLQARFYEANFRNKLFSGGAATVSVSNSTFTTGTLTSSATPILGLYNPLTSGLNAIVLQASLAITMTALQNTGCGAWMWCTAVQQTLTLGTAPLSRKTLTQVGSGMKDMCGIALTGLSGSLSVRQASSLMGGSSKALAELDTAIGMTTTMTGCPIEQIDGAFIVPPGGVLALLCTTTPVAHSAASGLLWAEETA